MRHALLVVEVITPLAFEIEFFPHDSEFLVFLALRWREHMQFELQKGTIESRTEFCPERVSQRKGFREGWAVSHSYCAFW